MRFRDKGTGKIQTCDMVVITDEPIDGKIASLNKHTFIFRSIEQFNDNCEDYKPAEPLIKDEKVRKAVRAWAEATGTTSISYWGELESEQNDSKIKFDNVAVVEFGDNYTIEELCGEEEE